MLLTADDHKIDLDPEILKEKAAIAFETFCVLAQKHKNGLSDRLSQVMHKRQKPASPLITLKSDYDDVVSKEEILRLHVLTICLGLIMDKLSEVLSGQDCIGNANKLNRDIIGNIAETGQPADFLLSTYDRFGKTFISVASQSEYDRKRHAEIAEQYIRDLVDFSATGAPTTMTLASINGASFHELGDMQRETKYARDMLGGLVANMYAEMRTSQGQHHDKI